MVFDEKFKEKARAEDAVERLCLVRQRLEKQQAAIEARRDARLRFAMAACIAVLVYYAVGRL